MRAGSEDTSDKEAPKKRRRWIWWTVLGVVVLAAAAAVAYPMLTTSSSSVNDYQTSQVTKTDLRITASGSGNTVVGSAVTVDPGITGTVEDLSVKLGQTVKVDTALFTIVNSDLDDAIIRAEVSRKQAKQQLIQSEATLKQAENNLYNVEHPSAEGSAPVKAATDDEIELAELQVESAKAGHSAAHENYDSAAAEVTDAQETAAKRSVTAPVAGMVTALNVQNGASVGSGTSSSSGSSSSGQTAASTDSGSGSTAVVEISDMSTLRAQVQINEVDLVNVKVGQTATVEFDALPGKSTSGTVMAVSPTGTNSSGVITYDVDIKLAAIDSRLRPSMSCSAEIETALKEDALVVPAAAVKTSNGESYVQVLEVGDTEATKVTVTTGATVGTQTEILTGLEEGQYVVTSGSTSSSTSSSSSGRSGAGFMMGGGRPPGGD